jgi:ankyrin repeat protein
LLRAAKTGDAKVVKLLLEHGANPLATVGRGVTSILLAANVGTSESDRTGRRKTDADAIETIRLLMAAGVDLNAADGQGRTAAHGAALWGMTDLIRFLHESGVDLNRKDSRGLTPLQTALGEAGGFGFGGRAGVVREETAKVIAQLTGVPLPDANARAALWGLTDVLRFLHANGVDLNRKDSRGLTPLQTALGEAGGFGFGGRAGVVREDTAKAIAELTGVSLADARARAATAAAAPPAGRTQDPE